MQFDQNYVSPGLGGFSFDFQPLYISLDSSQHTKLLFSGQKDSAITVSSTTSISVSPSPSTGCAVCGNPSCRLASHAAYTLNLSTSTQTGSKQVFRPQQDVKTVVVKSAPSPSSTQIENPRIDPFARYPVSLSDEEHFLLDLWAQPWGLSVDKGPERAHFPTPFTMVERLRPFALQHPVLLYAVMSTIAIQRSLARGKADRLALDQQTMVSKLHMEAVQIPGEGNSDANIIAGLAILSNHMGFGHVDKVIPLADGLFQMVKDRGGLHQLGMGGMVSRYVLLTDHWQSLLRCCRPVYPTPLPSLRFPVETVLMQGHGFRELKEKGLFDDHLCAVSIDMCRTMQLFEVGCRRKMTHAELGAFEYLTQVVEYQLSLLHANYFATSQRNNCVVLALLLMNHVVLRNPGWIPPGVRLIESRFWLNFQAAETAGLWNRLGDYFLMWIILTPLVVAVRGPCAQVEPVIQKLKVIQKRTKINGWEDLKAKVLQPYLWFEISQEEVLRSVWQRVESET